MTRLAVFWQTIIYLFLMILMVGCRTSEITGDIPFTSVIKGDYSNFQRGRHTIKSAAEWQAVLPNMVMPAVDFNREMFIAVLRGPKRTSGYSVEITRIESTGSELRVYVDEHEPGFCNVIFVLTAPFHVVQLDRIDLPISYQINTIVCQ
jgi:hypothetical protein